ncbi:Hypothetical predicted protein [Scomber scombrus]|uniref:Uncharacterized protein n=1 Tax=Scomber scombrus TaxID=13677 RepID=A0AAV1MW65_SCOSC
MPSVCEHDSKYAMGSSFSPPDRLNPCENTVAAYTNTAAIGATTPASSPGSHTQYEVSDRDDFPVPLRAQTGAYQILNSRCSCNEENHNSKSCSEHPLAVMAALEGMCTQRGGVSAGEQAFLII